MQLVSRGLAYGRLQEEQFADEFLKRDGLGELIGVINSTHGNQLAVRQRPFLTMF